MRFGYEMGGSAAIDTRRRWLTVLLAFLLGVAMVVAAAAPASASASGSSDLQPGWDEFPTGDGTVAWASNIAGELEVTFTVSGGPANMNFDVGLIQTDLPGVMLTGVQGGAFDFTGLNLCCPTREGQTVGPYNGWTFGEDFTTDGSGNGSKTVTLEANDGTWDVQFIVVANGGTRPYYESEGKFGTTVEVTVVDEDTCDPEVEGDCAEEDENGSGADVVCVDGSCLPVILTPLALNGDNAAFGVDTLANPKGEVFEMVVTMASRADSTPPGIATVDVSFDGGVTFVTMEKCTQTEDDNCIVSIIAVRGGLTQYTLQFDVDPNFRFR